MLLIILIGIVIIIYICVGLGMNTMVYLTKQRQNLKYILGSNYEWLIIYAWPWVVGKIYDSYRQ